MSELNCLISFGSCRASEKDRNLNIITLNNKQNTQNIGKSHTNLCAFDDFHRCNLSPIVLCVCLCVCFVYMYTTVAIATAALRRQPVFHVNVLYCYFSTPSERWKHITPMKICFVTHAIDVLIKYIVSEKNKRQRAHDLSGKFYTKINQYWTNVRVL